MTTTSRSDAGDQDTERDRQRWHAFAVCIAVAGITIIDLSTVNVALPSIQRSLGASNSELQLIVAGYALAFGLALVPAGRLGDLRSRRLMFVVGLIAFTTASLLCAIAPSIQVLVVTRILQGFAAGTQMPQVIGLVQQLFRGEERGRAFGIFGAMVGISTALGPTIGGALIALGGEQTGWRYIFWLNVPYGLAALYFAVRLLPRKRQDPSRDRELDLVGIVLLGVAVVTLMLPFVLTSGTGDSPLRWLALVGTAVSGALFVWWERHYAHTGRSPVVHFDLFRLSSYRNGLLIAAVYFAALPATFLMVTLYLQEGLHLEPLFAGMVSIPFAATAAAGAWFGGRLVNRIGRALVVWGLCAVVVGFVALLVAATTTPASITPWAMAGAFLIGGAGGGLVVSPNQTLTLAQVPVEHSGVAGSMQQLGQRVGTAIGTAVATSVFYGIVRSEDRKAGDLTAYHDAFRAGTAFTVGLVVLVLALAIVDLVSRKKRGEETPVPQEA
ncbi:MFS transporter [Curtobacterium sp. MCBD17_034]|uniref:MFS transporter n=1 Tax=unclassified Curtobacterium TaxID=257496 RepID=UPI000DA9B06B|nr:MULTISPECIES: MFS transporter [unclassified Curtobacterium]PZE73748.1 MFS transporter [Curtobacterium sp. MCBD17_019]PZF57568.1 MFS transporter [Curtobacterium sp. MCBD17_034]PZF65307.1 MFS transporter [Curtobacterium sp. MCBD17_013]PZM33660.1 MFS transporter [Curtobacterium sp. MCBD17_031]WIE53402.1 MFS transporter [Curtobacterium sp. MCBD17_003]